jgi:Caspase domain
MSKKYFFLKLQLGLLLMALSAHAAWANTESRLALIIGNSSYKSSPLRNPVNDVRLMEQSLKDAGFTVLKAENASLRDMRRLVRDFGDKLKASGGVGLFYFAGHGVQVRGENYLVSVDSDIRAEDEVAEDSVNTSLVLEKMQTAGNRMNIVILDACRNNPFAASSRSAVNGLAAVNAPSGTLVAYSTSPGSVAYDGNGANSLYTQYLATALRQPGSRIEDVFKDVRAAVRKETGNKQTPWENTALEGQFYFKPALQSASVPAVVALAPSSIATSNSSEITFWDSVKNSPNTAELQTYIRQYPKGVFADLAKARIDYLRSIQTVPSDVGLGILELTQTHFKTKTNLEVKVVEMRDDKTIYSTGDVVGKDGQVLAVRVGDIVLRTVSGQLWSTSSKVGTSGQARVEHMRPEGNNPGNIKWTVTAAQPGQLKIEANIDYMYISSSRSGGVPVYGTWSAIYPVGQALPIETVTALRAHGWPSIDNFVTTVFKTK